MSDKQLSSRELTGYPSKGIEIQSLVVNPEIRRELAVGDHDSFKRIAEDTTGISAIVWNEECISLVTKDPATTITFRPEINPTIGMFFSRDDKRMGRMPIFGEEGQRVWEGDYSPALFTKSNLLKFLKMYSFNDVSGIVEKVKEMKIHERNTTTESMISLDDDENVKQVTEKELTTNIPKKFTLEVPLIQTPDTKILVNLEFEAQVVKKESGYAQEKGTFIQLRCLNARETLRSMMQGLTISLPKSLPRYYGKLHFDTKNR